MHWLSKLFCAFVRGRNSRRVACSIHEFVQPVRNKFLQIRFLLKISEDKLKGFLPLSCLVSMSVLSGKEEARLNIFKDGDALLDYLWNC